MQKNNAKPKEVMVDGEEDKYYNRIQTGGDGHRDGDNIVGMGCGWDDGSGDGYKILP